MTDMMEEDKLLSHPEVLKVTRETYRFHISLSDLRYVKSLPIDIRLLLLERVFRKYGSESYRESNSHVIWTSFGIIKEYIRVFIAGVSKDPELYKRPQFRSKKNHAGCCLARFVNGETDRVLTERIPDISQEDLTLIRKVLDEYILTELQEFPFWDTMIQDNVLVFDLGSRRNIDLYTLGTIEAFRYKELTRDILKFEGVSSDGNYYIDD